MGIVYEATQLSLNRRVALKILPFAAARTRTTSGDSGPRAAGRRPVAPYNIVPVFSGRLRAWGPFYAMQFIEGRRRPPAIQERPEVTASVPGPTSADERPAIPPERWPGWASQAAEALDTTPIDRGSSTATSSRPTCWSTLPGNLWITDFGLARFQADTGLTLTGDLIGTLAVHEPGAGAGPAAGPRPPHRYLFARCDALRAVDPAPRGLRRPRPSGGAPPDRLRTSRSRRDGSIRRSRATWRRSCSRRPPGSSRPLLARRDLADDLRRFLDIGRSGHGGRTCSSGHSSRRSPSDDYGGDVGLAWGPRPRPWERSPRVSAYRDLRNAFLATDQALTDTKHVQARDSGGIVAV